MSTSTSGVVSAAELVVPARYNGPPGSGHGGYTCGRLAALAPPPPGSVAAVTLLAPPPLDTAMAFRPGARRSALWNGDELVATVTATRTPIPAVDPVTVAVAAESSARFLGRQGHPFPTCFACGPDRPGDGLGLAPGRVAGRDGTVACVWVPLQPGGGVLPPEVVWSALDCPGGWVLDPRARPAVLSRMTAEIRRPPRAGHRHVLVARREADHGRTASCCTSLYDADGVLLARSAVLWTVVDGGDRAESG